MVGRYGMATRTENGSVLKTQEKKRIQRGTINIEYVVDITFKRNRRFLFEFFRTEKV